MNRVPSNSSYLNKISHSGNNMKQAITNSKEAAAAAKNTANLMKKAESAPSGNINIYQ